jgi:hypothetical protein
MKPLRRRRLNFRAPHPQPAAAHRPEARRPRFDLSDPLVKERIDKHYAHLKGRTLTKLEVLHYLETREGAWHCLDFDLAAPSPNDLDGAVARALSETPEHVVPTAAARDLWMRMVQALPCTVPYRVLLAPASLRVRYLIAQSTEVN